MILRKDLTSRHCLYIDHPPLSIPCWWCGHPCWKMLEEQTRYPTLDYSKSTRWEYNCNQHEGLNIEVTCVKHDVPAPNWFFNRIAVTHENLRLYWNFYAGNKVDLQYRERTKRGYLSGWSAVSLQPWPPKFQTYPSSFLTESSPEKLLSFFKMYRTFS